MTCRVAAITLAVKNVAPVQAFYEAVLGVEFSVRRVAGFDVAEAEVSPLKLRLVPRALADVHAEENLHQLTFVVPDAQRAKSAALAHGGTLAGEPQVTAGGVRWGVRDPDGNSIELMDAGQPAR